MWWLSVPLIHFGLQCIHFLIVRLNLFRLLMFIQEDVEHILHSTVTFWKKDLYRKKLHSIQFNSLKKKTTFFAFEKNNFKNAANLRLKLFGCFTRFFKHSFKHTSFLLRLNAQEKNIVNALQQKHGIFFFFLQWTSPLCCCQWDCHGSLKVHCSLLNSPIK